MQQSGVRSRINSVQLNIRHCRKTFHIEMFYRCLTVMNDNSYDNIIHIYTCEYLTENCLLLSIIYTLCVGHLSISFHMKSDCMPSSGCWLFSKEYVSYVGPITVDWGKMSKEEWIYILRMCHLCTISGNSRKSTITGLNKTLEDFLLFFSSYLSLWFQCEALFCTAMPHDTENSV